MQRKTQQIIVIAGAILLLVLGLYQLSGTFAPGSYPFAEIYEINAPEQEVIQAISQFKAQHPDYVVPRVTVENKGSWDLAESEGRENNSHWYFIYFYYPNENKIVFTWTRPEGKTKTSFALVALNDGLDLGHWKNINDDFGFFENRSLKKQFEERIVMPIIIKVKRTTN